MSTPLPALPGSPWTPVLDRLRAVAARAEAHLARLEAGPGTPEDEAGLEMAVTQLGGQLARVTNLVNVEDGRQALEAARRRVPRQRDSAPWLRAVPDVP